MAMLSVDKQFLAEVTVRVIVKCRIRVRGVCSASLNE